MANRRLVRTLVRAPKRTTFWAGGTSEFTITTGSKAMGVVVTESALENVPNPTLIRIHGDVILNVTARTAADDSCVMACGMIFQSAAAIAAGGGLKPQPAAGDCSFLGYR